MEKILQEKEDMVKKLVEVDSHLSQVKSKSKQIKNIIDKLKMSDDVEVNTEEKELNDLCKQIKDEENHLSGIKAALQSKIAYIDKVMENQKNGNRDVAFGPEPE